MVPPSITIILQELRNRRSHEYGDRISNVVHVRELVNFLVIHRSEIALIMRPFLNCNLSPVRQNINENQAIWIRHDGVNQGNVLLDYLFSFVE